jgi:hypothetical protein
MRAERAIVRLGIPAFFYAGLLLLVPLLRALFGGALPVLVLEAFADQAVKRMTAIEEKVRNRGCRD